jgi:hypothetical protein
MVKHRNKSHHPLATLIVTSDSIPFLCTNCIYIYACYYNQFILPILHFRPCQQKPQTPLHHRKHTKYQYVLPLLFILYTLLQIGIVSAIYHQKLPIHTLSITPSLFMLYQLPLPSTQKSTPTVHQTPLQTSAINEFSTDSEKLSYLCAWNSIQQSSQSFMNFNPGGMPICIDTGASCCISNDKNDFINLSPSSDTVLKGISSGLRIDGSGMICWKITNDLGNEVSLHIHNSLYVPAAPMCLLSPQSVIQQTQKPNDGFQIYATRGVFTFSGFRRQCVMKLLIS